MKKSIQILTVLILTALILSATALPTLASNFDFDTAIAEFVPNQINTESLTVGEKATHRSATWTQMGDAECYSSDESVVTVSPAGTVTAVSEGTAYVVIVALNLSDVVRYDVVSEESQKGSGDFSEEQQEILDQGFEEAKKQREEFRKEYEKNQEIIEQTKKEQEEFVKVFEKVTKTALGLIGISFGGVALAWIGILGLLGLLVLTSVAEAIYILIAAPKAGMTRAWALLTLFTNVIGLIVFLVVRSNNKKKYA